MAYKNCCYQEAIDPNASYCGSCSTPLIRCISFQECGQLVEPFKPCPVCLAPQLVIESGAVVSAKIGDRLAVPLIVRNQLDSQHPIPRPVWVQRVFKRERGKDLAPVAIDWHTIDAGKEREFYLDTGPFDVGGTDKVDVFLEVASRSKEGFDETHIFKGTLGFPVARDSTSQVVQNINLSGAHLEDNALVHLPSNNSSSIGPEANTASQQRQVVKLEQVESLEKELGTRAYGTAGPQLSRALNFQLKGFTEEDAPSWDVGLGAKGYLAFGRSDRELADDNPFPMDVRLRCYNSANEVDVESSLLLSRHHFDLLVMNDRLVAFARSGKGISLNGKMLSSNSMATVNDGDKISPLAGQSNSPAFQVKFNNSLHGVVDRVEIIRIKV